MSEFRILGPLEVTHGNGLVPLGGQKQRALLAILLLHRNEVVSTDRLIDELWGEQAPRTATTSLHNTVSQLRKLLGAERLLTRPPGYVLALEPDELDAARFERMARDARTLEPRDRAARLRDALALWRGAPLAEFTFEPFAQSEIRRLEEVRLAVLEDRVDADLEVGLHGELVGELEALVGHHPLRERLRGQLMLALYRCGRQADALHAYHDARRALVDELGIEPSPALRRLHASILRQEATLAPAAAEPAPHDHYGDVVKAMLASRLVPMLGPGVTLCGRPDGLVWERTLSPHVPGEDDVAAYLADYFECPAEHVRTLVRVSQYVAVTKGLGPLYDELHAMFDFDYEPSPVHRFLASLPPVLRARGLPHQLIVSTGYDLTLERAFEEAGEEFDVVSYIAAGRDRGKFLHIAADAPTRVVEEPNAYTGISLETRTVILKIHGQVDRRPDRDRESFVVSEDDYIDYLAQGEISNVIPVTLAAKLRRSHFLFLGYGLEEWNLRVFLRRIWGHDSVGYRSWAVQPGLDSVTAQFWRSRGVDVYDVPLPRYVDELARRVDELAPREAVA